MAWSGSGLFVATLIDVLDATQLAVDLSSTSNKWALFDNAVTPDFDASAANAAYGAGVWASGEVSGTGYTAGGTAVASPTLTGASGVITYDQADTSWSNSTITGARGVLLYADGLAGNNAICAIDFGQAYSTSAGQFLIQWNAAGVFAVDLVP
ncbi:hypothetical protein [Actinomadura decatromicini]|uniref:Uncharacterized protein n=1 Tax=Actinomadura decatromicini TaxID=2604572 RepID=A0A5D3FAS4_9ACTN|nr:hypothetical protein [Actinomadura decatromicini]TYK45179.1 hypothetical protein FXF68_31365 [Actinomadura decatromicini]